MLAIWVLEFYEPEITDVQMRVYVKRMTRANFDMDVIAAGIEQYANTYVYGKTRNWAHLIQCCSEVADLFFQMMAGHYVKARDSSPALFYERVEQAGYGVINASYIATAHVTVGDSIRNEDVEYAKRRWIKAYQEAVATTETYVPRLEAGKAKSIKQLLGDKHGKTRPD
jgi:hypothetical protein